MNWTRLADSPVPSNFPHRAPLRPTARHYGRGFAHCQRNFREISAGCFFLHIIRLPKRRRQMSFSEEQALASHDERHAAHGAPARRKGSLRAGVSGVKKSQPISRVLSRAVIHLGRTSPCASSDLPEGSVRAARRLAPRPPIWSCSRWGLPCHRCCHRRGALLPHHFTLTATRGRGGIFSVALSVGSRPPGVTWHLALWSPDFPLRAQRLPGWLQQAG